MYQVLLKRLIIWYLTLRMQSISSLIQQVKLLKTLFRPQQALAKLMKISLRLVSVQKILLMWLQKFLMQLLDFLRLAQMLMPMHKSCQISLATWILPSKGLRSQNNYGRLVFFCALNSCNNGGSNNNHSADKCSWFWYFIK